MERRGCDPGIVRLEIFAAALDPVVVQVEPALSASAADVLAAASLANQDRAAGLGLQPAG